MARLQLTKESVAHKHTEPNSLTLQGKHVVCVVFVMVLAFGLEIRKNIVCVSVRMCASSRLDASWAHPED